MGLSICLHIELSADDQLTLMQDTMRIRPLSTSTSIAGPIYSSSGYARIDQLNGDEVRTSTIMQERLDVSC